MRVERIGLAGLGLIGGSLGMALVKSGKYQEVIGFDSVPGLAAMAREAKAITRAVDALDELAAADLIIIATPVAAVLPTIRQLLPLLGPDTIITDTASTKAEIVRAAVPLLPPGVYFVGGHPFAGSERAGLAAADAYLFENAAYVLMNDPPAPDWVHDELRAVIGCAGSKILYLSPEEHDLIAAAVSHLPHLVAAALVNTAAALEREHQGTLTLAGGGFRDTTRIAGGDAQLWTEIFGTNRGPLLRVLGLFRAELDRMESSLAPEGERERAALLAAARKTREEIPARGKGLLGKVEEIVVAIQDRPGAIKEVLDVLAAEGINVKDIEILRLREGEGGTLRLSLENEAFLIRALALLNGAGLTARRR